MDNQTNRAAGPTVSLASVPRPDNEPVLTYAPGTPERTAISKALKGLKAQPAEIPLLIGGREIRTGVLADCVSPHRHHEVLGRYHCAGPAQVDAAIDAALRAKPAWEALPWEQRASIFLKAAELLAGPWRQILNGATMLNQSKTVQQAEIDAACEMIDFLRFNVSFAAQIFADQPQNPSSGVWNRLDYRPLEGYVAAVTPFNFTAIAGNLPASAALLGNTVVWKPASTAVLSGYQLMQLFAAAGLPAGVINFVPGPAREVGPPLISHPLLGGVSFTGSTVTFRRIWQDIAAGLERYRSYPRLVGETGGKNFVFAHPSADVPALVTALVRGAFEYQGQKCSAASRVYVAASLWDEVLDRLSAVTAGILYGDVEDFGNFMGAVIDQAAFRRITDYIETARAAPGASIVAGGAYDDAVGYFVGPTVITTDDPRFVTMEEEIFGPVLTLFKYEDLRVDEALSLCRDTSPYGLTGSIFAQDRSTLSQMERVLRYSAGNLYINDKPTGAVVGQQPFGGGRTSGTNDKAGGAANLLRWLSPRTIKETFNPPADYEYPYMRAERAQGDGDA